MGTTLACCAVGAVLGGYAGIQYAYRQPEGWALILPVGGIGVVVGAAAGYLVRIVVF